jgi:hypothetical protein
MRLLSRSSRRIADATVRAASTPIALSAADDRLRARAEALRAADRARAATSVAPPVPQPAAAG